MAVRGKSLTERRKSAGIGQAHLAQMLDITGPLLSALENGKLGGLPRGFAARYQCALDSLTPCYPKCGCKAAEVLA